MLARPHANKALSPNAQSADAERERQRRAFERNESAPAENGTVITKSAPHPAKEDQDANR